MRHAISKYPGSKAKNFNKNNKGWGGGGGGFYLESIKTRKEVSATAN